MEKFCPVFLIKYISQLKMNIIKRALWISDYFPRPHDMTQGVWALESIYAIKRKGIDVVVLSPTPWIPFLLSFNRGLRNWNKTPEKFEINSLKIFYPKCFHYPHRFIIKYLYNPLPYFESSFLMNRVKPVIKLLMENYPFQIVHTNFVFPSGFIGLSIKNEFKIPLIVHERSVNRLSNACKYKLRSKLYSKIVNEADAVISPNKKMAATIESFLENGKKVNVIRDPGNPASIKDISSIIQPKPEKYKNKKIILSVGSLIERKGHEFLIKAVGLLKNEISDIKCFIIGNGVKKNFLKNLIRELNLDQCIELLGKHPHEEVLKMMSWCDIFVLPSWDEAGGTVYGEAMSFSKPIIGCRDEGISELIEDGIHGILIDKRDEKSLAEGLKKLLLDEELSKSIGCAARNLVEKEFNYDFTAAKITELYSQVCRYI
jgi:glycosyltransferase involved in cell wall biosynthesis